MGANLAQDKVNRMYASVQEAGLSDFIKSIDLQIVAALRPGSSSWEVSLSKAFHRGGMVSVQDDIRAAGSSSTYGIGPTVKDALDRLVIQLSGGKTIKINNGEGQLEALIVLPKKVTNDVVT